MYCSCGGETAERKIQKNYKIIGIFEECKSCGRILWRLKPDKQN